MTKEILANDYDESIKKTLFKITKQLAHKQKEFEDAEHFFDILGKNML